MKFHERLEYIIGLKTAGKISKFESECRLSPGLISKAIQNENNVGHDKLLNIFLRWKDVNLHWLITGEGEPLLDPTQIIPEINYECKECVKLKDENSKLKDELLNIYRVQKNITENQTAKQTTPR